MIALIARYHRKGTPDASDCDDLLGKKDGQRLACLSSILRTAEYLEGGHNALVLDVEIRWDEKHLRIALVAESHPSVEIWQAEHHAAPLLESVFDLKVMFSRAS